MKITATRIALLVCLVTLAMAGVAIADEVSMEAEVLDLNCYNDRGAKGEGHASCAQRCLGGGSPMGLLVDGDVVFVDMEGSDEAALETLKKLGGHNADVKGETKVDGEKTTIKVTGAAKAE